MAYLRWLESEFYVYPTTKEGELKLRIEIDVHNSMDLTLKDCLQSPREHVEKCVKLANVHHRRRELARRELETAIQRFTEEYEDLKAL